MSETGHAADEDGTYYYRKDDTMPGTKREMPGTDPRYLGDGNGIDSGNRGQDTPRRKTGHAKAGRECRGWRQGMSRLKTGHVETRESECQG